jgi:hypothetical protein
MQGLMPLHHRNPFRLTDLAFSSFFIHISAGKAFGCSGRK